MGVARVKEEKVQALKGEFESLIMNEMEKIEDFCMKLTGIVTNIWVLGEIMEEITIRSQFKSHKGWKYCMMIRLRLRGDCWNLILNLLFYLFII